MARRKRSARPDVLALLRECKQRPWDDAPRLVLADWLEEHGENKAELGLAELIRLSCREPPFAVPPPAFSLPERGQELLRAFAVDWLGGLIDQVSWGAHRGLFRISCLTNTLSAGALQQPTLPEGWAWVERVGLLGASSRNIARAAVAPLLEQVGTLALTRTRLGRGWKVLAETPDLPRLDGLILAQSDITPEQLRRLLAQPAMAALRHLNLLGDHGGAAIAGALVDWPGLQSLTTLSLRSACVGDIGAQMLAACPAVDQVGLLDLSTCSLTDQGLGFLVRSPHLRSLRWLALEANVGITPAGLTALLESDLPLTGLALDGQALGVEGIRMLAGSPWTARLTLLDLGYRGVTNVSGRLLAASPHLGGLKVLRSFSYLDDETRQQLLARFGEGCMGF
jgi:uncharacterized protein (TIGR02996 family)